MVAQDTHPRWIGGYHLLREVGRGGTGTVWEAADEGGQRVALKLLHPSLAATEQARLRLLREARLVNQVHSPRVARVLDVEADAYTPFVVTELISGPTLDAEIDRLPYRAEDAAQLASELASTLDAVHAAGIAHRDLKPSNVILTSNGPTLIDFGIAQGEGDGQLTLTGAITGTPGYVSPELLLSPDRPEMATLQAGDWFALAALTLRAMTGRPPFGSGRPDVVLNRVLEGGPDTDGLEPRLAEAFRWALHGSPEQRLSPDDLINCLAGAELVIAPATAIEEGENTATGEEELHDEQADLTAPMTSPLVGMNDPYPVANWTGLAPSPPYDSHALTSHGQTIRAGVTPGISSPEQWQSFQDDLAFAEPAPAPPTGPFGTVLIAALVICLAWLPALWRLPGLVALAVLLVGLQLIGGLSWATWQRKVRHGTRRSPAIRALALPWRMCVALAGATPGVIAGAAVLYVCILAAGAATIGSWKLMAPLQWMTWDNNEWQLAPVLVWLTTVAALIVWWAIPTTRKARVGLGISTRALTTRALRKWLTILVAFALALLGFLAAAGG